MMREFLNVPKLSNKERIDKIILNTFNNLDSFENSLDINDDYNHEFLSKLENNIVNISNTIIDSMEILNFFGIYDLSKEKSYSFFTKPKDGDKTTIIKHTLSSEKVELGNSSYYYYLQRFMQNPISMNTIDSSRLMLRLCIRNTSMELSKQIFCEIIKKLLKQKNYKHISMDSLKNYISISEYKTDSNNLMLLSDYTFDKLDFEVHNEMASKFNFITNESIPKGEIIFIEDPLNTVALGISDIFGITPKSNQVFSTFDVGITNLDDFKRIKVDID